jgi:hypothetical protein
MPFSGIGFGLSTIVWLIVIVILAGVVWRGRKTYASGTPIALTSLRVQHDLAASTPIEISGRVSGIVSWVLTVMRLQPTFHLRVTQSSFSIVSSSLGGIQHTYIPLNAITLTACGYQRSILAFGLAVVFCLGFVLNLISGFLIANRSEVGENMGRAFGFLILAGGAAIAFYFSKRIAIQVETGHPLHGLSFKPSVIESTSVDLPQALKVIEVLNALVLKARTTQSSSADSIRSGAARPDGQCLKCFTVNPADVKFCENCGDPLS